MVYSTLFVATDEDLSRLFWRWRRPLPTRVQRTVKHPISGAPMIVRTWDPGPSQSDFVTDPPPSSIFEKDMSVLPPVITPDDDDQQSLESDAPQRLRALKHAAMISFRCNDLDALALILTGRDLKRFARGDFDDRELPPARIVEIPQEDGLISALPEVALEPLSALRDDEFVSVACKLDEILVEVNGIEEYADLDAAGWVLRRLRALAQSARASSGNLFLHEIVR